MITTTLPTTTTTIETTDSTSFSSASNESEEKALIVVSQVLNENLLQTSTAKIKTNDQDEESNDYLKNRPIFDNQKYFVNNLMPSSVLSLMRKESSNLIEYPGGYVNLLRKKLLKNSLTFAIFDCPKGYGYYLIKENDCSLFKLCEHWDRSSAIVTLNKCIDDKVFNFKTFRCVPKQDLDDNFFYNQNCFSTKFVSNI